MCVALRASNFISYENSQEGAGAQQARNARWLANWHAHWVTCAGVGFASEWQSPLNKTENVSTLSRAKCSLTYEDTGKVLHNMREAANLPASPDQSQDSFTPYFLQTAPLLQPPPRLQL